MSNPPASNPSAPVVAIVCNSLPPYRTHFHKRVVREMPEIALWTLVTHESGGGWSFKPAPEIRPVSFDYGESAGTQDDVRHAWSEWRKGGRMIDWLRANDARAVVMLGYNDPGRLRVIRWCRRNNVPLLLWGDSNIHGDLARGWKAALKKQIVERVIRASDALLPCGELGRQFFARYGGDALPNFYVPYEPEYELIARLPAERIEEARRKYQLAPGRRRLIFCARMIRVKRPDLVIDAFIALADQRPEWDLVMVGDGELRQEMIARVPERLRARVTWTGFIDDQATVSALYRLSDVLVLPSDYEPWALVVNEAVAAGLAVVCTNVVGAAHELVRDGVNGRLFAPGDLQGLIGALSDVMQPDRVDAMKEASAEVLADWRDRGDPVKGLRDGLRRVGVI